MDASDLGLQPTMVAWLRHCREGGRQGGKEGRWGDHDVWATFGFFFYSLDEFLYMLATVLCPHFPWYVYCHRMDCHCYDGGCSIITTQLFGLDPPSSGFGFCPSYPCCKEPNCWVGVKCRIHCPEVPFFNLAFLEFSSHALLQKRRHTEDIQGSYNLRGLHPLEENHFLFHVMVLQNWESRQATLWSTRDHNFIRS